MQVVGFDVNRSLLTDPFFVGARWRKQKQTVRMGGSRADTEQTVCFGLDTPREYIKASLATTHHENAARHH